MEKINSTYTPKTRTRINSPKNDNALSQGAVQFCPEAN